MKNQNIITLLLLTTFLCYLTATAHDFESNGIYYLLNDTNRTASVTYQGTFFASSAYTGSVTIPATVIYNGVTYSVTSIDSHAFYGCDITNLTIPNTVTSIGEGAFFMCI